MGSTIGFGTTSPRVKRGDVLAVGAAMPIAAQSAQLVVHGAARIRQELSLEVAAYDGEARVRIATDEYRVGSFRRIVVVGSGGSASARTSPVTIDATDVWDRTYLGIALELDRGLTARSRGISLQTQGTGAAVKARLLDALSPWEELRALGESSVGDAVVAAEVANAAGLDERELRDMLATRTAGASWGLIAFELGLTSLPRELPGVDETAVPVSPVTPVTAPDPVTTPTTAPSRDFVVPGAGPVTTTPPPTTTPPTTTPAPVVVDPLGGVVSGLGNVLGGLLGAR